MLRRRSVAWLREVSIVCVVSCTPFDGREVGEGEGVREGGTVAPPAPPDASVRVDGGPRVCPPGAFCDDFERDTGALRGEWPELAVGGALSIAPSDGAHGRSLLLTIDESAQTAALGRPLPSRWRTFDLELDLRLDGRLGGTAEAPGSAQIVALQTEGPPSESIYLRVVDARLLLSQQLAGGSSYRRELALPNGAFAHVHWRIEEGTDGQVTTVTVGSERVSEGLVSRLPSGMRLRVGSVYSEPKVGARAKVWFDDVVVRTTE